MAKYYALFIPSLVVAFEQSKRSDGGGGGSATTATVSVFSVFNGPHLLPGEAED